MKYKMAQISHPVFQVSFTFKIFFFPNTVTQIFSRRNYKATNYFLTTTNSNMQLALGFLVFTHLTAKLLAAPATDLISTPNNLTHLEKRACCDVSEHSAYFSLLSGSIGIISVSANRGAFLTGLLHGRE